VEDMKLVLSGKEARIKCKINFIIKSFLVSFAAISPNRIAKHLEFNDLLTYFINSWIYGFRNLSEIINLNNNFREEFNKNNIFIPSKNNLDYLVDKHNEEIKNYLITTFTKAGVSDFSKGIDYEVFKTWLNYDHTLEICYFNKRIRIAVDLMCLDDIGINMNVGGVK
jgi:hypothetical protein